MKRNLVQVVGALSIGALALSGCKSKDSGGEKPAAEQPADGENKCPGGEGGENKCPGGEGGENKCPGGESKCPGGE